MARLTQEHHIREAARAHTNLNIFAPIVLILEGGCVYGDLAAEHRIIMIAQAEMQRQLRIYDKHVAAAQATKQAQGVQP